MPHTIKFKISNADLTEYKQKIITRRITEKLIKKGEISRATHCEKCGIKYKTVAHHTDYGQPDNVMWLCDSCHGEVHRNLHEHNPKNIKQTAPPALWAATDYIQVSFAIPIENFIYIKKLCKITGKTFSKVLRGCILEKYPVDDDQLEFNFKGENDAAKKSALSGISLLEYAQECLYRQQEQKIPSIWGSGENMADELGKIRNFPIGYGDYARKLQWPCADRSERRVQ